MRPFLIEISLGAIAAALLFSVSQGMSHGEGPLTQLHYAPNHNFDASGNYAPRAAGFNLADVGSLSELDALPASVSGLVWVGMCGGTDATFRAKVRPFANHPKLYGFYLMDEPDPTGKYHALCTPDHLKEEATWIHANLPGAKTFIVLMPLSSKPSFANTYNPDNSHIDLYGIDPYPCRTELQACDFNLIRRYVAAAEDSGILNAIIVPVYQAFGGGQWRDDGGGKYRRPTPDEMRKILVTWGGLTPAPAFDYAYSWGTQSNDEALETNEALREILAAHNARRLLP